MDSLIISAALDTNGQNARYARASERWGTDAGVLKALAIGEYDPASVVGRFVAASDKVEGLRIRSAHRSQHIYQQMPADLVWDRRTEPEIRQLALEADILHLNNSYQPLLQLAARDVTRRLRQSRKPMLLHHHGSLLRSQVESAKARRTPPDLIRWARHNGAVQAVSTVDLMRYSPDELHWLPTAYDIDALQAFGEEHRREPDGRVRIVSAPTNREFKSTALLEAAVAQLQAEGLPIDLVLVEGKPWAECMAIKATADVYFDQVKLGYGCNAVEAWGMGIPVIAGADEWTLATMQEVYGSKTLPFYQATPETIADTVRTLLDPKKRTTWANRGLKHVRKFHDERPALTRLAELYGMALAADVSQSSVAFPSVSFTARVPQVTVGVKRLTFIDGTYTTDNPHLVTRLREMATRIPSYGIEEVA